MTSRGSMTLSYSFGRYAPRSRSAICHTKSVISRKLANFRGDKGGAESVFAMCARGYTRDHPQRRLRAATDRVARLYDPGSLRNRP